ncbi:MAG TPA: hydroxymethylglutaryl-CoA lyase [Solirubrobacteraceae bacterium]|nr:hydroxymethylglutaryl-CoA lyase [Solirubrobacteraceae bacterium]
MGDPRSPDPLRAPPVLICDVSPRDGLQNEDVSLTPELRAELVGRLLAAGCRAVEAGSVVREDLVPQMAGSETVVELCRDAAGQLALLVFNERGLARACEAGAGAIHVAHPVTDEFAVRNQGLPAAASLERNVRLIEAARAGGRRTVGILAASFGCPFEGEVPPGRVAEHAQALQHAGAETIVLADTIGAATPRAIREVLGVVVGETAAELGLHLHNTRNAGYANAVAGLEAGIRRFDASVGGFGGCPFAPRATGNVATEDLAWLLEREGAEHRLDIDALCATGEWLGEQLGRPPPGLVHRAGRFPASPTPA